ncbi:MAG: EamA family transporter, partial [Puniceicoccales bacterium]|jgi:drug/metabolite transporter (DMT)-like permease|nr:EamA family transporter [Puniceicoccales bacterium]
LFTIFTPLYVTLLDALLERRLVWRQLARAFYANTVGCSTRDASESGGKSGGTPLPRCVLENFRQILPASREMWGLGAAVLAILGAGVLYWRRAESATLLQGFFLVQASNFCFAFGQIAYKRLRPSLPALRDFSFFAWLLAGGFAATCACSLYVTDWSHFHPAPAQWGVLIYLGTIASGVGFFLWNRGALLVNAGTLAVFNNLKIPLGVLCSLVFFGETAEPVRLIASLAIMGAAVWLAERTRGRGDFSKNNP